jgi:hypothetical protein
MSQRNSGYARVDRDRYITPNWVTSALGPHLPPRVRRVWEPACGDGEMARELERLGLEVVATDIDNRIKSGDGIDFLLSDRSPSPVDAIITNPPFNQALEFVEHALAVTKPFRGVVAILAPVDFDSAKTRARLFGACQIFAKKIVLTRRIVWFERPGAAPSSNHAWLMWDWRHKGLPVLAHYYEDRASRRRDPGNSASRCPSLWSAARWR